MSFLSLLLRRSKQRRSLAALSELDDHLLRDIGLTRSDLYLMMPSQRGTRGIRTHE